MNEDCVCVGRSRSLGEIQRMPDCASMIRAVVDDVKQNFQARHLPMLAIDELE